MMMKERENRKSGNYGLIFFSVEPADVSVPYQ